MTRTVERGCILSSSENEIKIALIGDSHAQSLRSFFILVGEDNDLNIIDYASSNCALGKPLSRLDIKSRRACVLTMAAYKERIKKTDVVIIVSRWDWLFFDTFDNTKNGGPGAIVDYYEILKREIVHLKSQGVKKIVLVNQVPKYNQYMMKLALPLNDYVFSLDKLFIEGNKKINKLAVELDVVNVDFSDFFCNDGNCSPIDKKGNILR